MSPQMFRYKSVGANGDFIVCRSWDGVTEGTVDVKIARPPLQRQTPYDGLSRVNGNGDSISYVYTGPFDRDATGPSGARNEVIKPAYVVDDIIMAFTNIVGGTAVLDGVEKIVWQEFNLAPRGWRTPD